MPIAHLSCVRLRFYNNDGTVCNGGKLYTYAAGTSTPKTSYTHYSSGATNTNPIILNSKGECDLWLDGLYKLNLLQSDDTQVTGFPVDNIGGDIGSFTHAATAKTTPADADEFAIADSAASFGLKRLTWANLKANSTIVPIGYGGGSITSNIAMGDSALDSNTTGHDCVALGSNTLTNNTTGNYNIGIGYNACSATATVNYNIGIGYAAVANATGGGNTGLGGGVLGLTSTGTNNTGLGLDCGYNNTTGSNNSFIGYFAEGASASASNAITLGNTSISVIRAQVTSITALSDERDKTEIVPCPAGLDFVNSLNPVFFTWNMRDGGKVGIKSSGFIAQQLKAAQESAGVADNLKLVYEENPDKLEASYGHLLPVLVKAIQELSAEVEALKARLTC